MAPDCRKTGVDAASLGPSMSARNPLWDFTALIPAVRRQRLLAIQSFQEVIERVVRGSTDFFATELRGNPPAKATVWALRLI